MPNGDQRCETSVDSLVAMPKWQSGSQITFAMFDWPYLAMLIRFRHYFIFVDQSSSTFQLVVASVYWISKADLDFSDIRSQIFVYFEADSNFSRYLSAILQQLNKMCSASQMVANEHEFIIKASHLQLNFHHPLNQQRLPAVCQIHNPKFWGRTLHFEKDLWVDCWIWVDWCIEIQGSTSSCRISFKNIPPLWQRFCHILWGRMETTYQ